MTSDGFPGDDLIAEVTSNLDIFPGVTLKMLLLFHPLHLNTMDDLDVADQVPGSAHHLPTSGASSVKNSSTLQELPDVVCLGLFLVLVGGNSIHSVRSHLTTDIS